MQRARLLATLTSITALLGVVSCGSNEDRGAGATGGTSGSSSAGQGNGGTASGGTSNGGATAGTADAGENNGGTAGGGAGSAGQSGAGGTAGSAGQSGAGGSDAGTDAGSDAGASEADASVTIVGDGEPCPNGNECGAGLVCVGYGNPLPNGESTACRRQCTVEDPPAHCTCGGAGYCEQSVGDPDAGSGIVGCGDTDAGCTCGEVIINAGCADADEETTDFESGEFQGCLHWRDLGAGQGWIQYDTSGGFHYDLSTSLGWVLRTTSNVTLAQAADFCANFEIAGLSDWRLPTINEARSLAGGCVNTAPGGSCTLSDSSCLNASCGLGSECTSCSFGAGPYPPSNDYCRPDVEICLSMHTSSMCPDCPTPGDWRYGPINGNFFSASVDQTLFPVCVMENIPRALPCGN
jgi:hypothetical protein